MPATTSQQHKQQASTSTSAAAAAASQPSSLAKPQIASRVTSPDDGRRDRREPQLYVWVVTINRDVTNEEFQRYLSAVDPSLRRALEASLGAGPQLASRARGLGTLRKIVADLLPRMLMTRQRIPNAGWRFARNSAGKWYIDSPPTTSGRTVSKVMGFGLAERDSMIGMAFAQGYKQQVVNVGMDIVRIPDHVDNEEAETFIGSLMHKLAPEELSQIVPALPVEKKLSRLCIMLAVKEAYLKALGQPHGFDLSRIAVVINPGGRSTMSVDKQPVYGWEFRLFTTDIGVSPTVRAQQPAASSGAADVLDVRGRPTDPDPRSWRSANTNSSSSRVMAGAGPSSSTTDDRVPPARLASLSSGRLMGGAGPTGYEGGGAPPATSAAQTALGRSISLARTSSAPITTSTSRHAPSASASYPSSGYRPNLSSASSSVSSVSSSISSAATTRAYTSSAASHHANGVRPGTVPARTGSMPSVLQHPSHVNGAGSGSGGGYSAGAQTRLFAGQGPTTSASTTSASGLKPYTVASSTSSGPSHPRATALSSTSTSSLGSSRTAASSTSSLASTASTATTMASHSDEPRVVQERYQCATAMWRGWTDRTEVVFAERDRDEMTSWLQFLTVTALARSVGSGVRNDPAP